MRWTWIWRRRWWSFCWIVMSFNNFFTNYFRRIGQLMTEYGLFWSFSLKIIEKCCVKKSRQIGAKLNWRDKINKLEMNITVHEYLTSGFRAILTEFCTISVTNFDWFLTNFWPIFDQFSTSFRPIFDQFLTNFWPISDQFFA